MLLPLDIDGGENVDLPDVIIDNPPLHPRAPFFFFDPHDNSALLPSVRTCPISLHVLYTCVNHFIFLLFFFLQMWNQVELWLPPDVVGYIMSIDSAIEQVKS